MRVTHVITRLIVGGAQENTIATVLGLRQRHGLETDLISGPTTGPEGSLENAFVKERKLLTIVPELIRPVHPISDFLALNRLTEIFRATKPQIVHTHSGKAGILGRLAARRAEVPVIVHTIHGPSFGPFQGALANTIFTAAERHAARATTHFISVADAMTKQYLAAGIGRPEQYTRIFSGFPLSPFLTDQNDQTLRAKYNIAPDDFVLGKIARLFELKGHDDLIAIAPALVKQHPNLKFLLVGDGPWRERLQARVNQIGLAKNFIFTGLIPPAEIPAHLGIMNALVHLSRREGLPRALSQALAAGKPVVAYDCDGAPEICLENHTGFLVKPGDLATLSARLSRLIADPALCQKFGEQGRQYTQQNFSVEKMVDDIHDLYNKLGRALT